MKRTILVASLTFFATAILMNFGTKHVLQAAPTNRKGLSHDVFFSLKDKSPEAKKTLLEGCKRYLVDHPGVLFFSVGTLTPGLNRPVNDRDFDVALHIVFADQAAHDAYQVSKLHTDFVQAQRDTLEKVRVFDSDVEIVPVK
ncbi:MAG: Dabb family protein [Planctomycetota bacterium]